MLAIITRYYGTKFPPVVSASPQKGAMISLAVGNFAGVYLLRVLFSDISPW